MCLLFQESVQFALRTWLLKLTSIEVDFSIKDVDEVPYIEHIKSNLCGCWILV